MIAMDSLRQDGDKQLLKQIIVAGELEFGGRMTASLQAMKTLIVVPRPALPPIVDLT